MELDNHGTVPQLYGEMDVESTKVCTAFLWLAVGG
jgi:hypothetical protein